MSCLLLYAVYLFNLFPPQSLTHELIMSHAVVTSAPYICLQDFFPTHTFEHMITITQGQRPNAVHS